MDDSETAEECKPDSTEPCESDAPEYGVIGDELHYVCHEAINFPPTLIDQFTSFITKLDLSSNRFDRINFLGQFSNLRTVVLDRNRISDTTEWPKLPQVTDLSMNYNFVRDIDVFLSRLEVATPQIGFLSLLGNPVCPFLVGTTEDTETEYTRYRIYVSYRLRTLRFLDVAPLNESERQEARIRGKYLRTVKKAEELSAVPQEENPEDDTPKYTPLPDTSDSVQPTSVFGRCKYVYQGKQSEGNRFIMNGDL